jgi:peptidoglycan/xylan/chitin deacetylase (PgdA/CDA1 family)
MTTRSLETLAFCLLVTLHGFSSTTHARAQDQAPPVYVTLWFDTEDYILPQSDDAAKRLAETLTRLGVKATFKVVGEKARTLEKRGRKDTIRALQAHEIGYHSDSHSRQPTVAVYLQNAGWEDGIAEFLRREGSGVADIRRIFGVEPVCYGQPGSSWAPQAYPALRTLGIKMYLDEADHVGLDSQPFYYGGMLNVFNLGPAVVRMELGRPDNLARARDQFEKARSMLQAKEGGTISIYYHPCEFVHREFWDGVNFSRGRNPPPEAWKLPSTKPAGEVEKGFADFEQYIRFIKDQPGTRFVTASELMRLYADDSLQHRFSNAELQALADAVRSAISFQRLGELTVSAADVFWLLTEEAIESAGKGPFPPHVTIRSLDGPSRPFTPSRGGTPPATVTLSAFMQVVRDVDGYCRSRSRVPSEVWIGAQSISPESFLATLASFLSGFKQGGRAPGEIPILPARFTADRYVAEDSPRLWGWVIFPEGFHAPAIMELARLQAWTLKPAVLHY